MLQYTIYISPLLISTVILMVLGIYAWSYRSRTAAISFFAVIAALLIWVAGFILEIVSTGLSAKLFWANLQFFGITVLPVAWLIMVIDYVGHSRSLKRHVLPLSIVPLATVIAIWTNDFHHLFRKQPWIDTTSSFFPILVNDYGVWFHWVHVPFNTLLFIISFVLLVRSLNFRRFVYRRQIFILIISTLLPLAVDSLYVMGFSPIPNFNLTSVAFSFSGLLIGWGLFQYRFLDLMPVVRSTLIEDMEDAWIVVDEKNRIVDLNLVARSIIDGSSERTVGQPAQVVLAAHPEILECLDIEENKQIEVVTNIGTTKNIYDLRLSILHNKRGRVTGRLILLRDITLRKEMEREREKLVQELQDTLAHVKTLRGLLPICANCKKIRDDDGYWHQVEVYIHDHSEAEFSHGICPECKTKLYPEFYDQKTT